MGTLEQGVDARLQLILDEQHMVIRFDQAVRLGLTKGAIFHRARRGGPWQRMLPRVYLTVTGRPQIRQKQIAALLYAGEGSVITGEAALAAHGFRSVSVWGVIDVLIPHRRRRRAIGFVRIARTRRMPPAVERGSLRLAPVARAVADTVRGFNDMQRARAVVAEAVQRGKCDLAEVVKELGEGPIRYSAMLRDVLSEVIDGIRSAEEGRALDLVKRAGLPIPLLNADLHDSAGQWIACADGWWEDAGVALEINSREWHISPESWAATQKRQAAMSSHGILVVPLTPDRLRNDQSGVVAQLRRALETGRRRGPIEVYAKRRAA